MSVYTELRSFHIWYEVVVAIFSYIFTALVFYLVTHKTSRAMQQYKTVILLSAVTDFLFSTTTFLSMPLADMVHGTLFLMNSGIFVHVRHPWSIIIFSAWLFTLYLLLVNAAMIFVYRYNILCKQKALTVRQFALIYIALAGYVSVQAILCCFTAESPNKNYSHVISQNILFAEDTPTVNVYDATKIVPFLHLLHGNFICSCLYGTIIFTGYRVHKCLNFSRRFMSKNTINVQNQLTKIMLLQAIYPLVALVFPISLFCSGPMFGFSLPFVGIFLSATVSLIPIVNSITTCVVIPSFRRAILGAILGPRFGGKVSQTGSITIQGLAYNLPLPSNPLSMGQEVRTDEML